MKLLNTRRPGSRGNSSIALLIVLGLGLIVAVYVGLSIGQGDWKKTYIMVLALGAFPALLFLGSKYWVVIPFAMTASLPAIPIVAGRSLSFGELWVICSVGAFVLRFPFRREKLQLFRMEYIPVALYVGWAAFIWKANGAGLAILGASTVGGRSYVTIVMGLAAFFIICNQRIEEKDAKWIIWSLIFGAVCSTGWGVFSFFFMTPNLDEYDGNFYTWHQNLSTIPYYLLALIFARYSPVDLLSQFRAGLLSIMGVFYGMAVFSGKRAAVFACFLFPLVSAFMRRQYGFIVMAVFSVMIFMSFIVIGHNRMFHLPQTVQRVFWLLPGDWDHNVKVNTSGTFRRTLNKLAVEQVQKRPIIGQGFGFTGLDAWLATDPNAIRKIAQEGDHYGAFIMAASGQWHSTWLGISATFGIPGAVLWGFVWLQTFVVGLWVVKRAPPGSYIRILATMLLMFTVMNLMSSWTSGHAAKTFWNNSWGLGILLVLKWKIRETMRAEEPDPAPVMPRPNFAHARSR